MIKKMVWLAPWQLNRLSDGKIYYTVAMCDFEGPFGAMALEATYFPEKNQLILQGSDHKIDNMSHLSPEDYESPDPSIIADWHDDGLFDQVPIEVIGYYKPRELVLYEDNN